MRRHNGLNRLSDIEMPLQILSDTQAIETMKANVGSSWPRRGAEGNRVEPLTKPIFAPTFRLARGEKIFTIGSCFARNVENALIERGFELPSRAILRSDDKFADIGPNVLNNYGVPSIYNEVAWGLGLQTFVPEQNFFEIDGKYVDVHLNHALRPVPLETVAKRRAAIIAAYAGIRDCRIVVITLGLSECWYDSESGLYLNTAPRRALMRAHPGRFQLHVLDFAETKAFLVKTVEMLRDHGHPELRLILTVSPVPLLSTYRPQDVIVANTYSKSVLRAAAEEIVAHYDFVDYFPSFESVLTSQRDEVWEDNLTHIKKRIVDVNVSRMIAGYVEADTSDKDMNIDDWLLRLSAPDMTPTMIFDAIESKPDLLDRSPDLALLFAEAAVKLKRSDAAHSGLKHSLGADPARVAWVEAQLACLDEDFAAAEAILTARRRDFEQRALYWRMLVDCYAQRGAIDAVKSAADDWSVLFPRSAEPFRVGAKTLAKANRTGEADYLFQKARAMSSDTEGALDLDYAEFLAESGRAVEARAVLAKFSPTTSHQLTRLEDLNRKVLAEIGAARAGGVVRHTGANGARPSTGVKPGLPLPQRSTVSSVERPPRANRPPTDEETASRAARRNQKVAAIEAICNLATISVADVASTRRELEGHLRRFRKVGWCGPDNEELRDRCKASADAVRAAIRAAAMEAGRQRHQ